MGSGVNAPMEGPGRIATHGLMSWAGMIGLGLHAEILFGCEAGTLSDVMLEHCPR